MPPSTPESSALQSQFREQIAKSTQNPNYYKVPDRSLLGNPQNPISALKDVHPERLSGLPAMSDSLRNHEIDQVSQAIRNHQTFAMLALDADQLKLANTTYGHTFGDEYIRWTCGTSTQIVDSLNLSCQYEVSRSATAADEVFFFFVNPTPEDYAKIKSSLPLINKPANISLGDDKKFTFAISSALIHSEDPRLKNNLEATRTFLEADPKHQAYDFYNEIKDMTENKATQIKTLHELDALPLEKMVQIKSLRELINYITTEFGGGRIGPGALNVILRLTSIAAIKEYQQNQNPDPEILAGLDYPEDTEVDNLIKVVVNKFNQHFKPS